MVFYHPKFLVCGLNPHAGEDGHLGDEEICIINPALKVLMAEGINISYAMPADTLFTPQHLADCDAVIAMCHDQVLHHLSRMVLVIQSISLWAYLMCVHR